jgi:hypothetical protein
MLFSYVIRKAALPVADGAAVESSAPVMGMTSYRVTSLRNIFALIGNILERRLKILSSFASLDPGTELAQPLLLITQYPGIIFLCVIRANCIPSTCQWVNFDDLCFPQQTGQPSLILCRVLLR